MTILMETKYCEISKCLKPRDPAVLLLKYISMLIFQNLLRDLMEKSRLAATAKRKDLPKQLFFAPLDGA